MDTSAIYKNIYNSPLGILEMVSDGESLTGLWFTEHNYRMPIEPKNAVEKEFALFDETKKWLDSYFNGENPQIDIPLNYSGTDFQKEVWDILLSIPYGETTTYGEIANILAKRRGIERMAAQAVGGAVGRNPIWIIIPCHRVIGKDGSVTGYGGGIDRKRSLLTLEGAWFK